MKREMKQNLKRYFIKTYGCQANKNESERIATYLELERGLAVTEDWHEASVIILNTCSVRKAADDRVFGLLREMNRHFLGESGGKKVARSRSLLVGNQRTSSKSAAEPIHAPRKLSSQQIPQVILTGCMSRYAFAKLKNRYPILSEIWAPGKLGFKYEPKRQDREQAFVQISTGCNSFCTYCVVPYARGREKSRSEKEILAEVQEAVKQGYKEITLLGQNVNSWGLEKVAVAERKHGLASNISQYHRPEEKGGVPFVKLLRKIGEISGVEKIRFMTSNPWDFYDELIEEIGRNKKIDSFIHLPVQAGSDSVLARMNRGYTSEDYLRLVKKLREARSDVQIGTDIIVGFSGETEEDFERTVELVRKANFAVAFVAIYSVRPGTAAAKLYKDDVPFAEKKRRWEVLDRMINKDQLATRPKIV